MRYAAEAGDSAPRSRGYKRTERSNTACTPCFHDGSSDTGSTNGHARFHLRADFAGGSPHRRPSNFGAASRYALWHGAR